MLTLVHSSTWPDAWQAYVDAAPATFEHAMDRLDLAIAQSRVRSSALRPLSAALSDIAARLGSQSPEQGLAAQIRSAAASAVDMASDPDDCDAASMLMAVAEMLTTPRIT